jgi:hypothetical protein
MMSISIHILLDIGDGVTLLVFKSESEKHCSYLYLYPYVSGGIGPFAPLVKPRNGRAGMFRKNKGYTIRPIPSCAKK